MNHTYRIRPLVWERARGYGDDGWTAYSIIGRFFVWENREFKCLWTLAKGKDGKHYRDCASIEDGKRQAEGFYHERLMKALEPESGANPTRKERRCQDQ
jgi:hypothetical protein